MRSWLDWLLLLSAAGVLVYVVLREPPAPPALAARGSPAALDALPPPPTDIAHQALVDAELAAFEVAERDCELIRREVQRGDRRVSDRVSDT